MSDERNLFNGNGEPDAPTAEDRRLEALLAGLPRRRCPERVRRNVMAALQRELEAPAGGSAASPPRPARVVPIFRRRIARWLEAAALISVVAIGYTVYRETGGRFRFEPDKETGRKAEVPPARPLKQADANILRSTAAPSAVVADGIAESERLEKKVEELAAFRTVREEGVAAKDETAKTGVPVAVESAEVKGIEPPAARLDRFARQPSATPSPVSPTPTPAPAPPMEPAAAPPAIAAAAAPAVQPAPSAPEAQAFAMKGETGAVALKVQKGGKKSKGRAMESARPSEQQAVPVAAAARAIEPANVSAPVQWFDWYEIETSAPAREKYLARNTIQDIRPEETNEPAVAAHTDEAWNRFSESAVMSFAQFVETWGGTITDSQAVVVTPGNRRAILVECSVPAARSAALLNAVHQKRLVAVASAPPPQIQGVLRLSPARAQEKPGGQAGEVAAVAMRTVQTPPPIQRLNEYDLAASRISPFTNFFVQSPPASQQAAIVNAQMARNVQAQSVMNRQMEGEAQQRAVTAQMRQAVPFSGQTPQTARGQSLAQQGAPEKADGAAIELRQAQTADGMRARRFGGAEVRGYAAPLSTAVAPQTGAAQALGNRAEFGYPSEAASEPVRLYFILEPDQLPVQVAPAYPPENR